MKQLWPTRSDAHALALLWRPGEVPSARARWLMAKLNLFDLVLRSKPDVVHPRGVAARVLALAAVGDVERTDQAFADLARWGWLAPARLELAHLLVPYRQDLALLLLSPSVGRRARALRQVLNMPTAQAAGLVAAPEATVDLSRLLGPHAVQGGAGRSGLTALNDVMHVHGLTSLDLSVAVVGLKVPNLVGVKAVGAGREITGPLVSVLMTTFNSADRVAHAIGGLLAQTWRNLEVVVVDDASTDATADIVRALAAQDARVKFIPLPRNVGTYVAKTIGYHHASGDFITCHDSDDWSHPQRIERQMVPLMKDSHLVATMSSWVRITDDGQFYARGVYPLIRLNPASALFRRREVETHAGLWDAVRTGADSEFNARLPLVFGPKAIGRVKALLTFGAHRAGSLMTAADTGYTAQGLSPARLAYTEAWTLWHIAELRAGRKPRMVDAREGGRPYELPAGSTGISADAVREVLARTRPD